MRFSLALAAMTLLAAQAQAQTTPAAPAPATPAPPAATAPAVAPAHHAHATLQERFDQANTSHDGHLTLDQAKAGMPMVAKHFSAIDKDKKGYVTMDDIHAYSAARHAGHPAAHHPASPS
jgi:hypothetical protein